ncbi:MAG: hypothetical protein VXX36_07975 [Verrucomicrobiota bacterium]|nr:hypothetical protein [Verrucomicrobiota bacterium]
MLRGFGDIGGGDSDLIWQAAVNDGTDVFLSDRHLRYDLTQGNPNKNMAFEGSQLGVAIKI